MKNYLLLILIVFLTACDKKSQETSQKFIEPCEYYIMSYQVKDVSYHDSVKNFFSDKSYIKVIGDSIFNVSNELGQFLFNGNKFTYKVMNDSLILLNNSQRFFCKIMELEPNSFKLGINNKYLNQIGLIKPKNKRTAVVKSVKLEY